MTFLTNVFLREIGTTKIMKKQFYSFLSFLLLIFISQSYAQKDSSDISKRSESDILDDAEFFFGDENYIRAIPLFQILADSIPDDMYYKFKLGICYIYKSDEKEKAIKYLDEVYQSAPKTKDLLFYLGIANHRNYNFDDAIKYFNDYLATNPPVSKRVLVNKYIENCKNGKVVTQTKFKTDIKNLGPVINTKYSEYVPVISSDESMLIFTYRGIRSKGGLMDEKLKPDVDGDYYEDIFISQKVGNEWLIPESIGDNINTKGHDASIALSADGQKLFIFRSTPKDHGDIYMSMLDGEVWSTPERLGPTINTKYWEGSVSISSDEKTLYFASERPGGYGKRDIWMSNKLENGEWGEAINMGPNINTPLNEDAPFIHPDGMTLFLSSEGHNSIGGYDIMYSIFENEEWSKPINVDYRVNTTGDDVYYTMSADGERGYFSSDRKGGFGQQDIYVVSPGIQGDRPWPILALNVGTTSANEKLVSATINIFNTETDKKAGSYRANSSTGKYMFYLYPGNKYKIIVEYEGMEPHVEYVNLKSLDRYVKTKKDFKLYSKEYKEQNNIKDDSTTNILESTISVQLQDLKKTDKQMTDKILQSILKKYGDVVQDSVGYNIELGKYEDPANFNPAKIAEMGKIDSTINSDGTTSFRMGPFKTLLEAEIFKYTLLSKDSSFSKTAVVTVVDHGKRVLVPSYFSSEYSLNRYVPIEEKPIIQKDSIVPYASSVIQNPEPIVPDTNPIVQKPEPVAQQIKPVVMQQPKPFPVKEKKVKEIKKEQDKAPPVQVIEPPEENDFQFIVREIYSIREVKALRAKRELLANHFRDKKIKNYGSKYETENPLTSLLDEIDKYEKELKRKSTQTNPSTANSPTTGPDFEKNKTAAEQFKNAASSPAKVNTFVPKPAEHVVQKSGSITHDTKQSVQQQPKPAPGKLKTKTNPCQPDPNLDFSAFAGKDLNDTAIYNKLIRLGSSMCIEGLIFKVQIGAYHHPENFKYPRLVEFAPAEIKTYPDGITRFTMKEFKTLAEAEVFRQQVIKRGIKDALITAVYNGKRILLSELILVNFYNRKPVN